MAKRHRNQVGPEVQVHVHELSPNGDGVGRTADGRVVFVPGALADEDVLVSLEPRGKTARGKLVSVLGASPERIEAPCRYRPHCGGCDWMHLNETAQAKHHVQILKRTLGHALSQSSRDDVAALPEVVHRGGMSTTQYRTRARWAISARKGKLSLGYRAASSHRVLDIHSCMVVVPALDAVMAEVRAILQKANGEGSVQVGLGLGGKPVVHFQFEGQLPATFWKALDERVGPNGWAGAQVALDGATTPAVFGDPRPISVGADDREMVGTAGGFAQASDEGARLLAQRVAALAPTQERRVVELYAGSGTLSVLLARDAKVFLGVEHDAQSVAAARDNFAERSLAGKFTQADAAAFTIPATTETVVLDPPRTGARAVAEQLTRVRPKDVVYVSCDAQTMGRDLTILSAVYDVVAIEVLELFPQTSHFETVVALRKANIQRKQARKASA